MAASGCRMPRSSSELRQLPTFMYPSNGRPRFTEDTVLPPRAERAMSSWNENLGCCGLKFLAMFHRMLHVLFIRSMVDPAHPAPHREPSAWRFLSNYPTDYMRQTELSFEFQSDRRHFCDDCVAKAMQLFRILVRFVPVNALAGATDEKFFLICVGLDVHSSARLAMAGGFILTFMAANLPTNVSATFTPTRLSPDLCGSTSVCPASLELQSWLNDWGGWGVSVTVGRMGEIVATRPLSSNQSVLLASVRGMLPASELTTVPVLPASRRQNVQDGFQYVAPRVEPGRSAESDRHYNEYVRNNLRGPYRTDLGAAFESARDRASRLSLHRRQWRTPVTSGAPSSSSWRRSADSNFDRAPWRQRAPGWYNHDVRESNADAPVRKSEAADSSSRSSSFVADSAERSSSPSLGEFVARLLRLGESSAESSSGVEPVEEQVTVELHSPDCAGSAESAESEATSDDWDI